jgi:hypothetical protein
MGAATGLAETGQRSHRIIRKQSSQHWHQSECPETFRLSRLNIAKDSLVSQQDPMTRAEMGIVFQTANSLCGIFRVPYRLMDEQRVSG